MTSFNLVLTVGIFLGHSIYCIVGQGGGKSDPDAFQEEAAQVYSTIFHKYNERVRPPDNFPKPVHVTVEASLLHIRNLDIYRQEMESLLDLQIMWRDKRLAWYPYQVQEISANVSAVWAPDVVYMNGAIPPRPMFARKVGIKNDGGITWKRREAVTTMCRTMPGYSNQTCEISLGFVSGNQMVAFSNDTTFEITADFDNHQWEVYEYELVRNSNFEISLVVYLASKSGNSNGMAEGKNCSLALKYSTNGSSTVTWTAIVYVVFLAVACNLRL